MSRISLEANKPYTFALKYDTGISCSTGNILFTTTNDEQFFVKPEIAQKIYDLNLKRLEPFRLLKRVVGRETSYHVTRIGNSTEPAQSVETVKPTPQATFPCTSKVPSQDQDSPLADRMAACYADAIAALLEAKRCADLHGVTFHITEENVGTDARCMFIERSRVEERAARYPQAQSAGGASWRQ